MIAINYLFFRQYRESLLGKVNATNIPIQAATSTVTAQVEAAQQNANQTAATQVVDIFTTPFNGSATITTQALTHPHGTYSRIVVNLVGKILFDYQCYDGCFSL